ncbi:Peptidylprolyl isomerase [Ascochyta rabiei]|uniref:Peptidylprolyl isomerase n=1 Tax=Didymella rabiei TaxID=5454 RepID=UPI0022085710|nr:Peptidylprolyl isomerase [Ascochyta rabiei]UPX20881.1 Peptidylprolyl isomerase [Ascochyta rabiei]
MGIKKIILRPGDDQQLVKKYDEVAIEYTGWIANEDGPDKKGQRFDTSIGRGDTVTVIGMGRVMKGWDKGITGEFKSEDPNETVKPMALNEKARFIFTSDYGYGINGFPGHVPRNASLVFEMELKRIGPQRAP